MSKPRFIRSSQEDFTPDNNLYGFRSYCQNSIVNLNKVYAIYRNAYSQAFCKNLISPTTYIVGYRICFQMDSNGDNNIIWTYVSEIMRDSDYGRILELFEVKL
jgi:hypothetical protein